MAENGRKNRAATLILVVISLSILLGGFAGIAAISLSESTGTVRVWRRGEMITEIEKASPMPVRSISLPLQKESKE